MKEHEEKEYKVMLSEKQFQRYYSQSAKTCQVEN